MCPPDGAARPPSTVGRRQVLRAAVVGFAAPALLAGLGGCALGSDPDPLLALAAAAREDAELADAVVKAFAQLTDPLASMVDARRAHGRALDEEITRLDPDHQTAGDPPATPVTVPGSTADAALAGVLTALANAARQAAEAVPELPGYRAGLVGSIAACCAGYRAVLG